MKELILASASPRRRELLQELGISFSVIPSLFEEKAEGLCPSETALAFARGKAEEVFSRYPDFAVLGADTVVAIEGELLGKPHSCEEAKAMLRKLSGRTHSVFTGVCLVKENLQLCGISETQVHFFKLSEALIEEYVRSGLPLDKAGAYGIQDGYPLVESYEGSYTNVVGFPMELVREYLRKADIC